MAFMYKHRPSLPSLVLAGLSLGGGSLIFYSLYRREAMGECAMATVLMTGCLTIIMTGGFLIMAFARYKYTHLWKSTGARHSDKYKTPSRNGRSRR